MRDIVFTNLVNQLENCEACDGTVCFETRNINTEHNNKVIEDNYAVLRKLYKLSPTTRKPIKFTSQTLLQISRSLKYDINRRAKYIKSPQGSGTSYGVYSICVN